MFHREIMKHRTVTGYVVPDDHPDRAKLLAQLFCGLNSEDQAGFFEEIARIDRNEWRGRGVFQWRAMHGNLTSEGKRIINDLKDHTE